MSDLNLTGTTPGQPVTDVATIQPFAGVVVASAAAATPYTTASIALSSTADGALSDLGIGSLSADGSTYTVSGSPADVQAALRGLVFTPTVHQVPVGQSVTTGFTLTASDAAGAVTDAGTSVVATAADTPPTLTDTSATQVPTSSNGPAGGSGPGATSFTPFAYTTITDPDAGATETTTITLAQNGAATDEVGVLSGAGLSKTGPGAYTLAAASAAAETAILQALRFTPSSPNQATTLSVSLSVSDGIGAPVAATSSVGIAANSDGSTVVSGSTSSSTIYNETRNGSVSHNYSTVIDAVLSNGSVVYDQSFNLPFSDPQVQAAVTQAQAALRNEGASPNAPILTASSLYTQSQMSTADATPTTYENTQVTSSQQFGPTFLGPNTYVPLSGATIIGYLYITPGQLNINVNTNFNYTVDRTVTTSTTDLLSQQYIVTGTSNAMATSATTLVSSSAAGMEGNNSSSNSTIVGGVTSNGVSVLFASFATNLSPADTDMNFDLYLKNTTTGALTLVTTNAAGLRPNDDTFYGSVDGDGNLVALTTTATNIDPRGADGNSHLYVRNISAGTLTLIAPTDYVIKNAQTGAVESATNFTSLNAPSISGDGRYIAVQANNGGSSAEILVFDTATHTATDLNGLTTVGSSAALSQDGSTVVFDTAAQLQPAGVQPADTDAARDVYAYSLASNSFQLVSDSSGG